METKPNGYVIHETSTRVVIATGFARPSDNPKTGHMVQLWVLAKAAAPVDAVKSGLDRIVCGTCKHRGMSCYVRIANAPQGVWKAWRRGRYPVWDHRAPIFVGHAVRFGAYGDPAYIPARIRARIIAQATRYTGYSHQWADARYTGALGDLMASVDSVAERDSVKSLYPGARTFRVMTPAESLAPGEILCPASDEAGKRTTCAKCGLCAGAGKRAKDVAIYVHGSGARKFAAARAASPLVQLAL